MSKKSIPEKSTELSTASVDKIIKPCIGKIPASQIGRLSARGRETLDPDPIVVHPPMMSMEKRLRLYERTGALRQAEFFDEFKDDDDWFDDYDDLPEDGLSPYEIDAAPKKKKAQKEARKPVQASQPSSGDPLPEEGGTLPTRQEKPSSDTPKGDKSRQEKPSSDTPKGDK